MIHFFTKRLIQIIFVLLGVTILSFILVHLIPGSPWDKSWGQRAMISGYIDQTTIKSLDRRFGFDQPAWKQFIRYIIGWTNEEAEFTCGLICGNLGPSYRQRGLTIQAILFGTPETGSDFWDSRLGYSLRLTFLAFGFTLILGLLMGIPAALRANSLIDRFLSFLAVIGVATPNFIFGLLLILIFASGLGWVTVLPKWDHVTAWFIPAFVLSIAPACMLGRFIRTSLVEVHHQDYIRTARAKGVTEQRILYVHVFRNAFIPILTFIGPVFMELLASSFIVESMFGFPGIGREYWASVRASDYSMTMGLTLLYAVAIALTNLAVDAAYIIADPRLRQGDA